MPEPILVDVQPALLRWACTRSRLATEAMDDKYPELALWLKGEGKPSLKQIEAFAKTTHTPVGYFFLSAPPEESLPIPDFRTNKDKTITHPSPNLLDTIYLCQEQQAWYREFAQAAGYEPLSFVGSAKIDDSVVNTARMMRETLNFDLDARRRFPTWSETLTYFIDRTDELGVLVMVNGVVANNTHRKLDPAEFRGFTMADPLAPLVFINGADTKSGQMFTLAHELAHLWLGQTGVSDADLSLMPTRTIEEWCNRVAVEFLVPLELVRYEYNPEKPLATEINRLAKHYKASTLVILRRIFDTKQITHSTFMNAYQAELTRLSEIPGIGGGDFYRTEARRLGKRFIHALAESALEGQTLYRDALHMLGITKVDTFHKLCQSLEIAH